MCSPFGIRDFPILNSVPVTPALNAMIYEEIPLDIQWGPKATEPKFIYDGAYANQGFLEYMEAATSTTTLRFNGNSFNLISVQLCMPQHKSLLPQDKQRDCSGEIVMGFKTNTQISEKYLFLSVPIVTRSTTSPSVYLEALRLGRLDGKPTSLLTVLPKQDKHFISYSTCLQRLESQGTSITQARVFVFTEGLDYPAANYSDILRKISASAVSNPIFPPAIQLPDSLVDKSQATLFSITTETDYKSLLRYSQYYPQGGPGAPSKRVDNLNAYKCVPLDPSQNVKDGKIVVDTETGELLSQVLKDKDEDQKQSDNRITPAMVENIIAVVVACLLLVFVFLILAYIITNLVTPNAEPFFGIFKQESPTITRSTMLLLFVGTSAFILGLLLHTLLPM